MNLEPSNAWSGRNSFHQVWKSQADTSSIWDAAIRCHTEVILMNRLGLLFGSLAASDDPFAISFGDIDPCLRVAVNFRGAAAGVVSRRCAIVLAGLRDSITLLRFETRGRCRLLGREKGRRSDCSRECRRHKHTLVHKILQLGWFYNQSPAHGSASTKPAITLP